MSLLYKIGAGLGVLALLGASYWYLFNQLEQKNERIGTLEAEMRQAKQTIKDTQQALEQKTAEMDLWRGLYTQLQDMYGEINQERGAQEKQLKQLQEQQDVQDYMACPMPDDLYDWVRQN